jgi:hypothetical protein
MIAFASIYSDKIVYGIQKEKITDVTSRPLGDIAKAENDTKCTIRGP